MNLNGLRDVSDGNSEECQRHAGDVNDRRIWRMQSRDHGGSEWETEEEPQSHTEGIDWL